MKLKCTCGSERFQSGLVKITFIGIPCTLDSEDGPEYNDNLAKYSNGWDLNTYDEVMCSKCEKDYIVNTNEDGDFILDPA